MSELFSLRDVGMRYNGTEVLRHATLDFEASRMVALAGPNGAGKSTLLGIMAGLRPRYQGQCLFDGIEVSRWPRRRFAQQVSFVPQSVRLEFPFTAEQVVMMGRTPHCDGMFESPKDREAVERALAVTDTVAFRWRDFRSLSGGEKQRVILASVLAQEPKALLLDEPATFLDLQHQISIYRILRDLTRGGLLVIAATHDLNLAAAFSDRVVMLHRGEVAADAAPSDVLTAEKIRDVFGVEAEVHRGGDGRPWLLYGN